MRTVSNMFLHSPIVILLPLVLGIAIFGYIRDRKRREALHQAAFQRNWTYLASDPSLTGKWTDGPFGEGFDRRALNVIGGTFHNRPFTTFDYEYKTETRDSDGDRTVHTHKFRVLAVESGAWLPRLHVKPENAAQRLMGKISGNDIQLESEDFNRAFTVHADDRRFASDVLHPRLMEALLAQARDLEWWMNGTCVLAFHSGTLTMDWVDQTLPGVTLVLDSIPPFVWENLTGTRPA